jgi:hypothetical protein
VRPTASLPKFATAGTDEMMVRLVTSFATREAEVDGFVKLLTEALPAQAPPQSRPIVFRDGA